MKNSRREFIKKSAYAAAMSAIGLPAAGANLSKSSDTAADRDPESEWMELSVAHWRPEAKRMNLTRQNGSNGRSKWFWR